MSQRSRQEQSCMTGEGEEMTKMKRPDDTISSIFTCWQKVQIDRRRKVYLA